MAGPLKITLYVDIVSPFAYMGYYMLRVSFFSLSFSPTGTGHD
jgi:predicted DsbA family dithiol-disulfide isomerase